MAHIMVDLETFGTRPGSVIRSLGAVVFNEKTGALGETFYANIDRASCEAAGLLVDPDTEAWWEKQSNAAREALEVDQQPLDDVIDAFNLWWARNKGQYIWSQGANFDEVLLGMAMRAIGRDVPWDFWNVRCSRTVLALGNRRPLRAGGTHHNALDDAKAQAVAVAATLRTGIRL